MSMESFAQFFQSLDEMKPIPIEASKEVIRKRADIQMKVRRVSFALVTRLRQRIEREQERMKKYKADIDAGKEKVYMMTQQRWVNGKIKEVSVPVSNWDNNKALKEMHDRAMMRLRHSEKELNQMISQLKEDEQMVKEYLPRLQSLNNELGAVALRPQLSTFGDYIDELIRREERSSRGGWKALKKDEEMMNKLQARGKLTVDDFPRF